MTRPDPVATTGNPAGSGERMVRANGMDLCLETFGDARDPAILLIHGACASMIWWETELCEAIAAKTSGDLVVVAPDAGFAKKARDYATRLGAPLARGGRRPAPRR